MVMRSLDPRVRNTLIAIAVVFPVACVVAALRASEFTGQRLALSAVMAISVGALVAMLTPGRKARELLALLELEQLTGQIVQALMRPDYRLALQGAARASRLAEERLGSEHPALVHCLLREVFLRKLAKEPGGEALGTRALEIAKELGPGNAATLARALEAMAGQARASGHEADSAEFWQTALETWKRVSEAPVNNLLFCHQQLAAILDDLGRHEASIPHWREAIALSERMGNSVRRDIDKGNLAWALIEAGRFEQGEGLTRERLNALEPDKEGLPQAIEMLASMLEHRRAWGEAEVLRRRVVELFERENGPEHASVSRSLATLARVRRELGDWAEAETLLRRAVGIAEVNASEGRRACYQGFLAERLSALADLVRSRDPNEAEQLEEYAAKARSAAKDASET
ncbi:MAG: tetratricopeptide repeat protein [Proteobacteria bacterium]|nr:tetratricopeptide repeat protein [Pseudomonadota bacterium]